MGSLKIGVALLGLAASACAPRTKAPELADVTQREWTISRFRLADVRATEPDHPYVARVHVAVKEPHGQTLEARGAVAIAPDRAARMILVGPGGGTALDLWVTKDRFRFVVPAIHLEKRGGVDPEEAKGIPIGMLRWWFLSPLRGRLLLARSSESESSWLLRDGAATVLARSNGARLVALRRQGGDLEAIDWQAEGLAPVKGARASYVEDRYGLRVDVVIEEVLAQEPDPEAFDDPDHATPETEL